jgi:ribonuclease HI
MVVDLWCHGLIHDNRRELLSGFAKSLGTCSVMVAELWGVFEGLKLAWEKGHKLVELQMDAKEIVKALNSDVPPKAEGWSLCKRIWRLSKLE